MGYATLERRLLSSPEFVRASDAFVRVRLNAKEDGDNTALARRLSNHVDEVGLFVLDPSGERTLLHRGPRTIAFFLDQWGGPEGLARELDRLAAAHARVARAPVATPPLPWMKSLREALIQAHCDAEPVLVLVDDGSAAVPALEAALAQAAFQDELRARVHWTRVLAGSAEATAHTLPAAPCVAFVCPTQLGTAAALLATESDPALVLLTARAALTEFERAFAQPSSRTQAIDLARKQGLRWRSWLQRSTE